MAERSRLAIPSLLTLALFAGGCSKSHVYRTFIKEPSQHYGPCARYHLIRENRRLGEEAYQMCAHNSDCPTEEYRDGFVDGYADFLTYGGPVEPPPVVPRKYWKNKYLNPCGAPVASLYNAGFVAGGEAACASGLRPFRLISTTTSIEEHEPIYRKVPPLMQGPKVFEQTDPGAQPAAPLPQAAIQQTNLLLQVEEVDTVQVVQHAVAEQSDDARAAIQLVKFRESTSVSPPATPPAHKVQQKVVSEAIYMETPVVVKSAPILERSVYFQTEPWDQEPVFAELREYVDNKLASVKGKASK